MTWIKICGIKNSQSIRWAESSGASAVGFMFAESKRKVSPEAVSDMLKGSPTTLEKIGVFVNSRPDDINRVVKQCRLDRVQLHGEEPIEDIKRIIVPVVRAVRVGQILNPSALQIYANIPNIIILLDTLVSDMRGGTGLTFDWSLARKLVSCETGQVMSGSKVVVAGGLNPKNVAQAVGESRCFGVDVSSGVEFEGVKNEDLIFDFVKNASSVRSERVR